VPDYASRVEHAIRIKELPPCKGDPYYWRHTIRYPAAITIDDGRDARAQISRLEAGLTTWEDEYGEQGDDWREHIEQRVEELRYASELLAAANVPAGLFFTQIRPDLAADGEKEEKEEKAAA
jgi:capsid protein